MLLLTPQGSGAHDTHVSFSETPPSPPSQTNSLCGALVLPPSYLRLSRDAHANRFIQDLLSFDSEKTLHLHVSEELAD